MKPLSTLLKPLDSVDIATKETYQAQVERSDVTAVPSAVVVGEAMVLHVVAAAVLDKFGGDSLEEIQERWELWFDRVRRF
jgi:chorismate synthase